MKTLSSTLLAAQKSALRCPAVRAACTGQTHPDKAASIQWGMLRWEQLYSGSATPTSHGVAVTQDGSTVYLHRVRPGYYQRKTNPDESTDFSTGWTSMGDVGSPVAIAGYSSNVIIVTDTTVPIGGGLYRTGICFALSTDHGATFSAVACITDAVRGRTAVAVFPRIHTAGWAIAVSDSADGYLRLALTGLTPGWVTGFITNTDEEVHHITGYYDGDYNFICLVKENSHYYIKRVIYGNGYCITAGVWSTFVSIGTGSAIVDSEGLLRQYIERQDPSIGLAGVKELGQVYAEYPLKRSQHSQTAYPIPGLGDYYGNYYKSTAWAKTNAILTARAVDNLDLDAPFICKIAGSPPILSIYGEQKMWFFRLRPGTDFYDGDWYRSYRQDGSCPYGLALASDGTYLWASGVNHVWRARIPGTAWDVPHFGDIMTDIALIYQKDIIRAQEIIRRHATSELYLEVDTSHGLFASLPAGHYQQGSRLTLEYGYRSSAGLEYASGNTYFIEGWTYSRSPNVSSVTFHAIDAWGLLEHYTVPAPWEVNYMSNECTVYQLISRVVQCIGGTLGYRSRSTLMTSLYPRMEFSPGETGAGVLRRLLKLVPDVLMFNGFNAYVVYPQESDTYSYEYRFPATLSGEHPILSGSYRQQSGAVNRAYVIGKDTEDYAVFGEDEDAGEIDDVGERLQFILQTDLLTAALAEDVAEATLEKQRIDVAYGSILVPPNCGQELWDVVRITDTPCGRANDDYRITALLLVYDARDQAYYQRLSLGGV